jgi:DNA uptake protein ComE-like DNA-binding protein
MKSIKLQQSSLREASSFKPAPKMDACGLKFPWSLNVGAWNFFRRHPSLSLRLQRNAGESGSAFIIVLWIAFGLVSLGLYFGNSMVLELRASDNRASGLAAEQAIEGALRYVNSILGNQATYGSNGYVPDVGGYLSQAVPVGEAHFWLIGRDTNAPSGPGQLSFGLIDEASKLNLNTASSNMLFVLTESLPRANQDVVAGILDWRSTNGGNYQTYYATRPQPYQSKNGPFETVDELRLVYGADMDTVVGEDRNGNGVLDPSEADGSKNGQLEPGLLEYVTVYSREPNTQTNGSARVNIQTVTGTTGPLPSLLQNAFGSSRANQIMVNLGLLSSGPVGGANRGRMATPVAMFRSPLQFYQLSRMTSDEFAQIANNITLTNGPYILGRVNVNTASLAVLSCLPGLDSNPDLAQTLVDYRQTNPDKLTSVAWLVDALGQSNSSVLSTLMASDCVTAQSYQFSADIAALGPNGRGYRRVRVVFDTCNGSPKIVYRQDLTQLGWALGKDVRDKFVLAKATP